MSEFLKKVEEFHNQFNVPTLNEPTIPSKERCNLRVRLLEEEMDELKKAIESGDIVEISDALVDIEYILMGTVLEFGLKDVYNKLFEEVHRSNMSKACNNMDEVEKTMEKYKKEYGVETYFKKINDKYVVYRKSDNKVLKSINYYKPNLKEIIENKW